MLKNSMRVSNIIIQEITDWFGDSCSKLSIKYIKTLRNILTTIPGNKISFNHIHILPKYLNISKNLNIVSEV